MAKRVFQVILRGPGYSNRGVRYRTLDATERADVARKAGKLIAASDTPLDYRLAELSEGVKKMLVAVTKEPVPVPVAGTSAEPTLADESLWQELSVFDLTVPGGFDKWFTPKDDDVLTKIYCRLHETTQAEVESILGKALEVSTG